MYAVIKGRWLIFPRPIAVLPSPVSIGKVVRLGRQRFVVAGTIVSADKGRLPQHRTFDPQSAYLGAWGKVWLSCNYFLLHILMILHKTDNFYSSRSWADSSDDPCLSAAHGTKTQGADRSHAPHPVSVLLSHGETLLLPSVTSRNVHLVIKTVQR